jgi:D-alanyl-lipoteichoic acid acyltransferase DltB (MBOAT superfamily)
MTWPTPAPLFNPLVAAEPPRPDELWAGPFGLLAFLPLIPVVLLLARWRRRTALILGSLAWLLPTLRPATTVILLAGLAAGWGWLHLLTVLRRRGKLSERWMLTLVWVGLHALAFPLWWHAHPGWYPSRLAALHNVGFAYFLLRFVAWGVELARNPRTANRFWDTVCWLLYPPCMRLGPVLLRGEFLTRLDAWDPRGSPAWKEGGKRLGLFLLGGISLGVIGARLLPTRGDFFAEPQNYTSAELLRLCYLIPVQIYLLLWTYNQLALTIGHWLGLPVDNNFCRLPLATSVREFWRRWHITVGGWLRNYLYIPLGGSRRRATLNTLLTFGYCGLWHGPSWSFLAWALAQAGALLVQRAWDRVTARRLDTGECSGRFQRGWTFVCWLLTMHFAIATILVFADFEHLGSRIAMELWRRL